MSEIRAETDLPHPPERVEPEAPSLDDPSDPWALSDPLISAGVALPLPDEPEPQPELAESHPRLGPLRRLMAAFPPEQRVRAAAITVTAALVAVTAGWLWLTRSHQNAAPPMRHPQDGPVAGLPGPLPSGVAAGAGSTAGPRQSDSPAASEAPAVPIPVESALPTPWAGVPPSVPDNQPLTASYAAKSSNGLLGYKVKVTVSVHNPGGREHSMWAVVLTVPPKADLQESASNVDAHKDGAKVTVTPKSGAIDGGATIVFDVTFGGGALLGLGSGGVTGCTVDGAECTRELVAQVSG